MDHPTLVLLSENDPQARARAHTALGQRALQREDFSAAESHLREAIDLDPTDEVPKQLLGTMPPETLKTARPKGFGGWLRGRFLDRIRLR